MFLGVLDSVQKTETEMSIQRLLPYKTWIPDPKKTLTERVQEMQKVYLIVNESERGWLEGLAQPRGSTVEKLSRRYYGALLPAAILSAHPRSAPLPLAADAGAGAGIPDPSGK